MASIQDVARRAQVGASTVSRVLSGKGYVADATRKKVLAAIEELNYVPNELARNLLRSKTNTVAVIVPDVSNPFFANLVNEIEIRLRKRGYKTMLCNSFGMESNEAKYLDMLARNMVDGIITNSSLLAEQKYDEINGAIISIDSILSPQIPMVCSDHKTGGRLAAELLIKAGCKHVMQFRDSIDMTLKSRLLSGGTSSISLDAFPYIQRHVEFERTIREAGIRYSESVIQVDTFGVRAFESCAADGLSRFPDVDGVMATDLIAINFARRAMKIGKKIPDDIKIVAYDGTDYVSLFYPDISAIIQPIPELAERAVSLLLRRIAGEPIENNRVILPVMVQDTFNV